MDFDRDDLAALCAGMTKDEVDRVHRLLHEWSVGLEDSFPVQLALLTRAQWRMAARVPRSLDESRTWLELHLAEYRLQTKTMLNGFTNAAITQTDELKTVVEMHAKTTTQAAQRIRAQLADAEAVAGRVKSLMENATAEWKGIKTSTTAERERLEKVAKDLDDRFAWRQILWGAFWFLLTFGLGLLLGLYARIH